MVSSLGTRKNSFPAGSCSGGVLGTMLVRLVALVFGSAVVGLWRISFSDSLTSNPSLAPRDKLLLGDSATSPTFASFSWPRSPGSFRHVDGLFLWWIAR